MSDELRAARERYRAWKANRTPELDGPPYAGNNDLFVQDMELMIENDLAEHPADDDELLSHDVAEQMLADTGCSDFTLSSRGGQVGLCIDNWIPLKTRGDVLHLLSALGITPQ